MSGQTLTEKLLAVHAGRDRVAPGEILRCRVDLAMANDVTAPLAVTAFREMGGGPVWDADRVALVASHFVPAKDIASAQMSAAMRAFAAEQDIRHYFAEGQGGIEHVLLPEKGLVAPGELIVGADSHSCTYGAVGAFATGVGSTDLAAAWATGEIWLRVPETMRVVFSGKPGRFVMGKDLILSLIGRIGFEGATYKALQLEGEAVSALPMDDRFTLANMAVEAGAKNGVIPPDDLTVDYVRARTDRAFTALQPDPDAEYAETIEVDVAALGPVAACPPRPDAVVPVAEAESGPIDQVVIGSCTNGRLRDLAVAASVLKGRRVAKGLRLIVLPGSQQVYLEAARAGLLEVFVEAGAAVSTPTCGPCLGGSMGVAGPGERIVSTTSRNFPGRMGHRSARVWLVNPAVAAATAVAGRLVSPEVVVGGVS
jgi:3-isopropylmalate/(R)-2-methylmalate dehydratase large subunit